MTNNRNLVAACLSIAVFGFSFGMTYPLLSLILEQRGVSPQMIGLNSAMMPIGILMFSSAIPFVCRTLGAKRVAIIAAVLTAVLMISFNIFTSLESWFVLRLIMGATTSLLFVLSEAWIVSSADESSRGKVVAIYASVLSLSFAAGPAIVSQTGVDGWLPFVIGSVVLMLGVVPLLFIDEGEASEHDQPASDGIFAFVPKAPLLLACVFAFAIFDAATLSLLPIYAMHSGRSFEVAAMALTALIAGNIVLQLPIGYLSDKYSKRLVMLGCAVITTITLLMLPYTINSWGMWPVLIICGAAGYGIYTVALADLGDRFEGQELIAGSSAFATMWGLGALCGSLIGGWAMAGFGADGLPISMAVVYALLGLGLCWRIRVAAKST